MSAAGKVGEERQPLIATGTLSKQKNDLSTWRDLTPQELQSEKCRRRTLMSIGFIVTLGAALLMWATIKGKISAVVTGIGAFEDKFISCVVYFVCGVLGISGFFIGACLDTERNKFPHNLYWAETPEEQLAKIRDIDKYMSLQQYLCSYGDRRVVALAPLVQKGLLSPEQVQAIDTLLFKYTPHAALDQQTRNEARSIMNVHNQSRITDIDEFEEGHLNQELASYNADQRKLKGIKERRKPIVCALAQCQADWANLRKTLTGHFETAQKPVAADIGNDEL